MGLFNLIINIKQWICVFFLNVFFWFDVAQFVIYDTKTVRKYFDECKIMRSYNRV